MPHFPLSYFSLSFSIVAFFSLPAITMIDSARATDCVVKACIEVYTQNGEIVIEGKKGSAATKPPSPARPKTVQPFIPKPVPSKPQGVKRKYLTPHKPHLPTKQKVRTTSSLNDRLVKLLPIATIARQPRADALLNVPVIFWCDLPTYFATKVAIVGEVIDVAMRPSFVWSFGDGSVFITKTSGAPFPQMDISHIYRSAGRHVVTLIATWGGSWTYDGLSRAITGQIRQISIAVVEVVAAPTLITR
jgi:hypothetical protein